MVFDVRFGLEISGFAPFRRQFTVALHRLCEGSTSARAQFRSLSVSSVLPLRGVAGSHLARF